jgi:hypothetical protein
MQAYSDQPGWTVREDLSTFNYDSYAHLTPEVKRAVLRVKADAGVDLDAARAIEEAGLDEFEMVSFNTVSFFPPQTLAITPKLQGLNVVFVRWQAAHSIEWRFTQGWSLLLVVYLTINWSLIIMLQLQQCSAAIHVLRLDIELL